MAGEESARCFDFNVWVWERAARSLPGGGDVVDFFKAKGADFYDEKEYRDHMVGFGEIGREVARITDLAEQYVETGNSRQELFALLDEQIREILAYEPSTIGISVFYPAQLAMALALAKRLKEHCDIPIILGGATMAHVNAGQLLETCPHVDAVAIGEGEPVIEKVIAGCAFESIPGIACRIAGGISFSPAKDAMALESAATPDFSDFDLGRYFSPEPVLPVLYSRGCRWRRCRFCSHNFSWGGYRAKGAREFVDELAHYRSELGVRRFYFADQYIGAKSLSSIADEIIARNLDVRFHVMVRPTGNFTFELLSKLRTAGCVWMSWGIESGSQRLLELCDKGTNVETAKKVISCAKQAGISNLLMMIYGLPTSTDADLERTFDFIESVYDCVDAFTSSDFVLWDNTEFAGAAQEHGMVVSGPETIVAPAGRPVSWGRLSFKELGADGSLRPERGPMEIAKWNERRRWLGEETIFESLNSEHYLLYASHERGAVK